MSIDTGTFLYIDIHQYVWVSKAEFGDNTLDFDHILGESGGERVMSFSCM